MTLQLWMKLSGLLLILLAVSHVKFPALFRWREELSRLSLLNRQIFIVHSFFIAVVLLGFGALNLFLTDELIQPDRLSKALVAGMGGFWLLRLFFQLFVYDSSLWKGDLKRAAAHVGFTLFWTSLVALYASVLVGQL